MNNNLELKITNIQIDDSEYSSSVCVNICLNPFYATEEDISSVFLLEPDAYIDEIRRIIFNSSIYIDNKIEMFGQKLNMTEKQIFMIKRDYVICTGIYELGKRIHLDYLKSSNKQKYLGDIKVSLDIENDPSFISATLKDAKDCSNTIESLLNDMTSLRTMMATFVKGSDNPNNKTSWREWYSSYPLQRSPIAAVKVKEDGINRHSKIGHIKGQYYV